MRIAACKSGGIEISDSRCSGNCGTCVACPLAQVTRSWRESGKSLTVSKL